MSLKKYTVILLYPDYLCDAVPYGQEVYVAAGVKADDQAGAVQAARLEAFRACKEDEDPGNRPISPDDFALCVMFEGKHDPVLFGWQL